MVWVCDPMHANTFSTDAGRKTRRFEDIIAEIDGFFAGLHVSTTRGPAASTSSSLATTSPSAWAAPRPCSTTTWTRTTMTLCDPRLNARQSLDLAFRVAELMRAADESR